MDFSVVEHGRVSVLDLSGTLDAQRNADLAGRLDELLAAGRLHLVVDARTLKYINSRAVGDLMGACFQVAERGGVVAVVGVRPSIRKILQAVGADPYLPEYASVDEAVQALTLDSAPESP